MKTVFYILFFFALSTLCHAQEGGSAIKVTSLLHPDGTQTVTKTDPDQHTSEASTYDSANKLMQRIVYALDEQGQAQSGVLYTTDGKAVMKSTYKRDSANRVTEEVDYTMDGRLIRRFVYEYDARGHIHIRAFDANGAELQQTGSGAARKDVPKQRAPRR